MSYTLLTVFIYFFKKMYKCCTGVRPSAGRVDWINDPSVGFVPSPIDWIGRSGNRPWQPATSACRCTRRCRRSFPPCRAENLLMTPLLTRVYCVETSYAYRQRARQKCPRFRKRTAWRRTHSSPFPGQLAARGWLVESLTYMLFNTKCNNKQRCNNNARYFWFILIFIIKYVFIIFNHQTDSDNYF